MLMLSLSSRCLPLLLSAVYSFSSVVCPSTGQQDHRNDLSHPIHADNCLLDPEANECWKEPPAYTYRDYRCAEKTPAVALF